MPVRPDFSSQKSPAQPVVIGYMFMEEYEPNQLMRNHITGKTDYALKLSTFCSDSGIIASTNQRTNMKEVLIVPKLCR